MEKQSYHGPIGPFVTHNDKRQHDELILLSDPWRSKTPLPESAFRANMTMKAYGCASIHTMANMSVRADITPAGLLIHSIRNCSIVLVTRSLVRSSILLSCKDLHERGLEWILSSEGAHQLLCARDRGSSGFTWTET